MASIHFRHSLFSFPNTICPKQSELFAVHLLCARHCTGTSWGPPNCPSTSQGRTQSLTEARLLTHSHRLSGSKPTCQVQAFLQKNFQHQIRGWTHPPSGPCQSRDSTGNGSGGQCPGCFTQPWSRKVRASAQRAGLAPPPPRLSQTSEGTQSPRHLATPGSAVLCGAT